MEEVSKEVVNEVVDNVLWFREGFKEWNLVILKDAGIDEEAFDKVRRLFAHYKVNGEVCIRERDVEDVRKTVNLYEKTKEVFKELEVLYDKFEREEISSVGRDDEIAVHEGEVLGREFFFGIYKQASGSSFAEGRPLADALADFIWKEILSRKDKGLRWYPEAVGVKGLPKEDLRFLFLAFVFAGYIYFRYQFVEWYKFCQLNPELRYKWLRFSDIAENVGEDSWLPNLEKAFLMFCQWFVVDSSWVRISWKKVGAKYNYARNLKVFSKSYMRADMVFLLQSFYAHTRCNFKKLRSGIHAFFHHLMFKTTYKGYFKIARIWIRAIMKSLKFDPVKLAEEVLNNEGRIILTQLDNPMKHVVKVK